MQTGIVQANLVRLNETIKLPYIDNLIQQKITGAEKDRLNEADLNFHQSEYERLRNELQQAHEASTLPETPSGNAALNDLLIRLRLGEKKT